MSERYSAMRTSLRTAAIMLVFTVLFTAMMSTAHRVTGPSIAAAELQERMRLINEVLPPGSFNNDLLEDYVLLGPTPELGLDRGGRVYRARLDGEPAALVLEVIAPDGYAGRIELAIAVSANGSVSGVRATSHAETPGLGDYIDPKKDRNRQQPWIEQFTATSFDDVAPENWQVRRDGGEFDYRVGATISARAVTNATRRALAFANAHRTALFDARAQSPLKSETPT